MKLGEERGNALGDLEGKLLVSELGYMDEDAEGSALGEALGSPLDGAHVVGIGKFTWVARW